MKAVFCFKNGKSETLNFLDLLINERIADVGLEEKMMRPPDKHFVKEANFKMSDIRKIEVLND